MSWYINILYADTWNNRIHSSMRWTETSGIILFLVPWDFPNRMKVNPENHGLWWKHIFKVNILWTKDESMINSHFDVCYYPFVKHRTGSGELERKGRWSFLW
jgi:hypothetical protein